MFIKYNELIFWYFFVTHLINLKCMKSTFMSFCFFSDWLIMQFANLSACVQSMKLNQVHNKKNKNMCSLYLINIMLYTTRIAKQRYNNSRFHAVCLSYVNNALLATNSSHKTNKTLHIYQFPGHQVQLLFPNQRVSWPLAQSHHSLHEQMK